MRSATRPIFDRRPPLAPAAPEAQARLSGEALARLAGIDAPALARVVDMGVIEETSWGSGEFTAAEAARLKRTLRLQHDLELDVVAAAIVVDLLQRLERVEAELIRLRDGHTWKER
jgi:hypothetical protein